MTWTPFFIAIILLVAFAFAINFLFGQAQFREAIKSAHHHKAVIITIVICLVLIAPFTIMLLQN